MAVLHYDDPDAKEENKTGAPSPGVYMGDLDLYEDDSFKLREQQKVKMKHSV
jgi:hypothetical protein